MAGTPMCQGCGQMIVGNYVRALDATWHPEHFVCAFCHRPIANTSFHIHEHVPYHPECYSQQVAPRCVYCARPLTGNYLIDHWGQKFCREHQHQFPSCAYCGRLVSPQQQEANASVMRCPLCRRQAIEMASEAKPIFSSLIRWVSSQGLKYNQLPIGLELCGPAKLAELLRHRHQGDSLGATTSATYTQNGQIIRTEVTGIAVLQGLPTTLFQGVVVHELGHVWLIVQGVQGLPSWAEEGFCELLSHRYYQQMNTAESQYYQASIERNPEPVYGEGFRRIRTIADNLGFARFLEIVSTTKRLPG